MHVSKRRRSWKESLLFTHLLTLQFIVIGEFEGYEVSMNRIETFNYRPPILHNDSGEPCSTIPRSTELDSYVVFRGPQVLETADLDLIGNCSRLSYCDKSTGTCLPKRNVGSSCHNNMECAVGMEYFPGHCNKNTSICGLRQDIPSFYYGTALRPWTMGKHWKEAVAAVAVTGGIAICFLVGRHQAGKLVSGVSGLIEKWQNRDDHRDYMQQQQQQQQLHQATTSVSDEEIWNQQHARRTWWHFLPGARRIARMLHLQRTNDADSGTYIPLDSRPTDPPPYRGN